MFCWFILFSLFIHDDHLNQQFSVHGNMIKKLTTSFCIKICYDPQEKVFKFHKFFEHVQKAFEIGPNLC